MIRNRHVNWETGQILIPAENAKDAESRRVPFRRNGRLADVLNRRRFCWLAAGLDLRSIQFLLGHADLNDAAIPHVTDAELLEAMTRKLWKEDVAALPDCQQSVSKPA